MADSEPIVAGDVAEPATFTAAGLREGMRATVPLAIGIFVYGIAFGVLASQAHLSLVEAMLMSGIVYAGSAQFAVLGLWVAPLPVAAIILTTLVVNLRHVLMGAALRPRIENLTAWQKYVSLFFMTDESWALTMGHFQQGKPNGAFLLGSGLTAFVAWGAATLTGETLGGILDKPESLGLDFAFTAVFVGLLIGFWKGRNDVLPWTVAAVVAILAAFYLPGKWYILAGGLAGSLVGALRNDS